MPDGAPTSEPTVADKVKGVYDVHGEKFRYVGVGIWNTLFNVVLYNILLLVFGRSHYMLCFWAAWSVAVVQSTVTMKYIAFRRGGALMHQLGRAYVVYLPAQGLSTVILWLGVSALHLTPPLAQLITIFITTIFSYVGHKYFTFRVPLEVGEVAPEDMLDGSATTN